MKCTLNSKQNKKILLSENLLPDRFAVIVEGEYTGIVVFKLATFPNTLFGFFLYKIDSWSELNGKSFKVRILEPQERITLTNE